MGKIKNSLIGLYFFILGNIFTLFVYDRKYIKGKYFEGRFGGINAIGWRWVVQSFFSTRLIGVNTDVPWPVSSKQTIIGFNNIKFHPDDLNNFQSPGCYFQAIGEIEIGSGTYIGPNVGIITANHDLSNLNKHDKPKSVIIGEKCWIGMNSTILGGVTLGDNTIVGAGSVVTKSFSEGNCIIVGNPAKVKKLI